jgi:ABC-2 type transport system permease protein
MKTIRYLLQKEFLQIFRNKTMLPIIFALPIIQLVVLVYSANLEMKNIKMAVLDEDASMTSMKMISKFQASPFFTLSISEYSVDLAENDLKSSKADVIIHIPNNFEKNLIQDKKADIQILTNAINGTSAGLINQYIASVIKDCNKEININYIGPQLESKRGLNIISRFWFNNDLDYKIYMLPGILVILVTVIGMFLAGLNLVREIEIGTIEQINVTPIKKYQFLIGKLLPFWLIALFELGFGLLIGNFIFDLPIRGSLFTLFGYGAIYLLVVLGIGLFLSTLTRTQQQLMFLTYFFMLLFILMGGVFTPAENMPEWAQKINYLNPVAYFVRAIRMILLKGSSFTDLLFEFGALSIYAVSILSMASWNYKKTV